MTQLSPAGDNRKDLVTTFIDGVPYIGNGTVVRGMEDTVAGVILVSFVDKAIFLARMFSTPRAETPRGRAERVRKQRTPGAGRSA